MHRIIRSQTAVLFPTFFLLLCVCFGVEGQTAPLERYDNLQSFLSAIGQLDQTDYDSRLRPFHDQVSQTQLEMALRTIDPARLLAPYMRIENQTLKIYRDRDQKQILDFFVPLTTEASLPTVLPSTALNFTLPTHRSGALQNMRIVLDPGHMGGAEWDRRTGKYLRHGQHYVSEGTLALWTCLLLKTELTALGAIVSLTHEAELPVSSDDYHTFDLRPYAHIEMAESTDAPWFDTLLRRLSGDRLLQAPSLQQFYQEGRRNYYFIFRNDLMERARLITTTRPDITIVLHFDSASSRLQDSLQQVRGFVSGNLMPGEVSTREQRFEAIQTALNLTRFDRSMRLTSAVVHGIAAEAHVPVRTSSTDHHAIKVSNGVYARNLALNRKNLVGAQAYIEALFYDYRPDFMRLARNDCQQVVEGREIHYPCRLQDVVRGVRTGILNYAHSLSR